MLAFVSELTHIRINPYLGPYPSHRGGCQEASRSRVQTTAACRAPPLERRPRGGGGEPVCPSNWSEKQALLAAFPSRPIRVTNPARQWRRACWGWRRWAPWPATPSSTSPASVAPPRPRITVQACAGVAQRRAGSGLLGPAATSGRRRGCGKLIFGGWRVGWRSGAGGGDGGLPLRRDVDRLRRAARRPG